MKRTIATQLALVNWSGVFYERYLLDRGVTALEGINGAGKTTVMVAAYVALLPDQRFLNFEPLAEAGARAEDHGIWGRLGEGTSAYSALDFRLGNGERLLAGIHLERKQKDSGELHPFLVHGLAPDVSLQRILLDRVDGHDEVPSPDRVAQLAALCGGRLVWSESVTEYLRDLFDAGVSAMPMSTDAERVKMNDLLRTSMMGGISRQLGDGLRSFLLRPEEGLGTTLKRMRGNLDDCRRTRQQVAESRRLEHEIHDVLEAGMHMFAAAIEGARRFAEERQGQAAAALRREAEARATYADLLLQDGEARSAVATAERDEKRALDESEEARSRLTRVERANEIWKQRSEEERNRYVASGEAVAAQNAHSLASDKLIGHEEQVRAREQDHQSSAKGMADIQSGLERLHSRASRYRAVRGALGRARRELDLEFGDSEAPEVLARCRREAAQASARLVEATGRLQSAKDTESAFRVVADALGRISVRPSADADAHALALEVLHGLRQDDELVSRLPGLRAEKQTAEQLAKRQTTARQVAAKLSRLDLVLSNQGAVRHALTACSFDLDIAREDLNRAKARQAQIGIDMEAHGRRLRTLLTHREECKRLRACVDPIAARHEQPVRSSAELGALLAWLQQRSGEADGRVEKLSREVAETEGRLHELRNAGGSVPAQLATATEAVEGRLLLERFEDIPFEQAAEVEARLGPLVHAILVDDPSAAARTLASLHSAPNTVWILDGPRLDLAPGRLPGGERLGMSVAAPVETGLRLTRLPPAPVVGRQARERLIRELEGRCRVQAGQLADARDVARTLAADRDALAPTLSKAHLLDLQDLDGEVARVNSAIAELTAEKASLSVEAEAIARRVDAAKARQKALEELWPDAHLLDPPDHAETMTSLELRITSCVRAERRLETIRNDRRTLEKGLDLLRVPPPDATELARLQDVVVTETRSRTRWLTPQADLDSVCADIEALEFAEAEEAIRKDEALLTSLNKEVEVAEQRLVAARQKRDEAKEEERAAEGHVRKTAATLQASDRRLANLEQDLERTGVEDASDESLEQARGAAAQASQCLGVAASATRRAGEVVARLEPQLTAAEGTLRTATQDREEKEAQAAPASERWASLRTKCEDLGFLDAALTDPALNEVAGKASIDVFQLRQRWWAVMLDRIGHATGGLQLSGLLQAVTGNTPEVGSEQFLRAWLETRAWLANRVPKHVSEVSDPVDALRRLRRYLDRLVDDLDGYEHRLRGDSKDIARAIEGRLRKVSNLLATLNGNLTGVGFGSIAAIQVKSERETRMNEVLTALSSEEEQARLFGTEMTIEEALNALFLRHGGRRDGGAKLLDYREYLRLRVEVKRRGGGSEPWEEARGNQMSTGESIGVGAAIMMVVLTAWERDASLLRARRESGTLRFLFLDEATRLSLDNLEILFDLCKTLDLQLLIAAPEVATSSGNTTYLLERTTDAEGRRVVQVSGRRAIRKGA